MNSCDCNERDKDCQPPRPTTQREPFGRKQPRRRHRPIDESATGNGIHLQLFGGPVATVEGRVVALSPNEQSVLTLIFARASRRISRGEAIWLMWEADDKPGTRHRLRQLLHGIRKKAGQPAVSSEGDLLRPHPTATSDVQSFEACLARGALSEAARLASRRLGGTLARCPSREFEDWLSARHAGLTRKLGGAAAAAWDTSLEKIDWNAANDAADALVRVHINDPSAIAKQIEARARVGRTAAAESSYADYLGTLSVDEESAPELVALIDRVRSLDLDPSGSGIRVVRDVPLVGRDEPLEIVRGVLSGATSDRFERIVVHGEPGIGKSRFLEEVRRDAVLGGFRCLTAQPVELEQAIGLNPIIDALREIDVQPHLDALGEPWKAVIASVLPEHATDGPPADIPPIQESSLSRRLMEAFWMLLDRIAANEPLLLIIDDIQWADPTTLALLRFIERRWASGTMVLLCALRPELVRENKPLQSFLDGVNPGHGTDIHLNELSDGDAKRLIRQVTGESLDEHGETYLRQLAGNHPFYLTELGKDHLSGRLHLPAHRLDAIPVPMSVQQIFEARIVHLSADAIRLASMLAVRARSMRLRELSEVTDRGLDECTDLVEALQKWHLVEVERDSVRISHELFRSTLYRRLSETRRALIHGRIALHLEATGSGDVVGELAIHYARAGESEKAVQFAQIAAQEALSTGAITAAAQYFEVVVTNTDDAAERANATGELGRTLHMDRQIERANAMLEVAAMRLRDVGNSHQARRMDIWRVEGLSELGALPVEDLVERLGVVKMEAEAEEDWEAVALGLDAELHLLNQVTDTLGIQQVFTAMQQLLGSARGAAACECHMGLAIQAILGDRTAGEMSARIAMELSDQLSAQYKLRARVRYLLVSVHSGTGYLPSSLTVLAEAVLLAKTSGDVVHRYFLEANQGVMDLDAGELDRAEQSFARADEVLGRRKLALPRLRQACNTGELELARGNFLAAQGHYQHALNLENEGTPQHLRFLAIAGVGLCGLELGDLREAKKMEAELAAWSKSWSTDPSTILVFIARLSARRGDLGEARRVLQEGLDRTKEDLPLAHLKLSIEIAARRYKLDARMTHQLLHSARDLAHSLCLPTRVRMLEREMERHPPGNA